MDIFKKKSLCTALAGMGALGAVGAAEAVNLNPDGLGQVLIYPYYTVRSDSAGNAYSSLLSVVNTTASTKAVKVRFLEGKNSREVLDFNLYLSMKDVWTTAIIPDAGGGTRIVTSDKSCTIPPIPSAGVLFRNAQYTADGAGSTLDRTREGYVEIIEMASYSDSSDTTDNVTHVAGVPPGCSDQTDALGLSEALPPTGGLMGGITLINVNNGSAYTEDAVALDRYSIFQLYTGAGVTTPDLTQATPPVSIVIANNTVYQSTWTPGPDPVSALLMHDHIYNEYVLDASTKSGTDWVVTMPTKRFYVANGTGSPARLFQRNFNKTDGSCDDVSLALYDREEQTTSTPVDFSPSTPFNNSLCWEANIVTFNNSKVLGSVNFANITTDFTHGWLDLGFFPSSVTAPVHTLINPAGTTRATLGGAPGAAGPATYVGLPVVGFAVQSFTNGTIIVNGINAVSTYGGNFVQKGTQLIN